MVDRSNAELRAACAVLMNHPGWLRALAVLNFTLGGLLALTVVGLLLAWCFVWIGWVLNRAAGALEVAARQPERFDAAMIEAMRQVAFHFIMQVVMMLILLGLGLFIALWGF